MVGFQVIGKLALNRLTRQNTLVQNYGLLNLAGHQSTHFSLVFYLILRSGFCVQCSMGLKWVRKPIKFQEVIIEYEIDCPQAFCKKDALKILSYFTEKHLRQSLFNKSCRLVACKFIKKQTLTQTVSVNFKKFLGTTFFYRTSVVTTSKLPQT